MGKIEMVDLFGQYLKIKDEIDKSVMNTINNCDFINGKEVKEFQINLSKFLHSKNVITCANGTDSLQIALMALNLNKEDEIICPAFTYVATAEVIGLLGLKPVMVDVDIQTYNVTLENIINSVTNKTKVIIVVHLYGQSCDMEPILNFAKNKNIIVIEDNAQAIGSVYEFSDGTKKMTGTMGNIGSTSFFPSKNLGCYGDGGALNTDDDNLAEKMKMIANHGQEKKYYHKVLGCNSRLDSIQAAILNVKIKYLDEYIKNRQKMADYYDLNLSNIEEIKLPIRFHKSSHVFHQYTLVIQNEKRDLLKNYLDKHGIPSMIYYPLPLYKQEAFKKYVPVDFKLTNTEYLCSSVLSIPIHTEFNEEIIQNTCNTIKEFFKKSK